MDHHFLIRYSFTGVVLLIFALGGLWIVNNVAVSQVLSNFSGANMQSGTAVISAIATVPVIGVMVHGLILLYIYGLRGHSFSDKARCIVAEQVRILINGKAFEPEKLRVDDLRRYFRSETSKKSSLFILDDLREEIVEEWPILKSYRKADKAPEKRLKAMPDDSLFVWLYYFDAPEHLIEWARRRRDYYYLGVSWALAAFFGLIIGIIIGLVVALYDGKVTLVFAGWGKFFIVCVMILLWMAWILCAFWLGIQMKHDVDSMELAWASSLIEPKIKNHFKPGLPGDLQEGLERLRTSVDKGLGGQE